MIFNSKYTVNLKFLDSILSSLLDSETHSLNHSVLYNKVMTSDFDNFKVLNLSDHKNIFETALNYLNDEDFLKYKNGSDIRLTYKGILKLSKGGFATIYEEEFSTKVRLLNVENFQNRIAKRSFQVNLIIAISTSVAAIFYLLEIFSVRFCLCNILK